MKKFLKAFIDWWDDLLIPRKLATVQFSYDVQYMKQNPVRKVHVVLARVRPAATPAEVATLFDLKAPKKTTYRMVDIKILPITKLPKA